MKREVKRQSIKHDTKGLLILILLISIILLLIQLDKVRHYKKDIDDLEHSLVELREKNDSVKIDGSEIKEYDCSFTRTYHVVDLLDGYVSEVPEWSYVIFDQYQSHYLMAHRIPSSLKAEMKLGKIYEVTYKLKGRGVIRDIQDVIQNNSTDDLKITMSIKETNKKGMEQKQENICLGK